MKNTNSLPIILALDVDHVETAKDWIIQTAPYVGGYKVGMQLFYKAGKTWLSAFKQNNWNLFLDLKLYDIPNTVASALGSLLDIEPTWITVHATGGHKMLEAAQKTVQGSSTQLIAVTCLTSFSLEQVKALYPGLNLSIEDWVLHLVQVAVDSGVNNIVCSPQEVALIKAKFGNQVKLFTPGVRPADYTTVDDQQRTLTPSQAIKAGSNYLIMGRPILQAAEPIKLLQEIKTDLQGVLV